MAAIVIARSSLIGGVSGSLDNIDGDLLEDKSLAMVGETPNIQFYYLDASSGETADSPYIIEPVTNPGTKRWKPYKPVWPSSCVSAYRDTVQNMVKDVATTVIFATETRDTLGEYNNTTGIYTAKGTDEITINAKVQSVVRTWTMGRNGYLVVYKNGAVYGTGPASYAQAADSYAISFSVFASVPVVKDDYIDIRLFHTATADFNLAALSWVNTLQINGTY